MGCGAEDGQINLGPLALEVHYHGTTADMPLVELKLHSEIDNYRDATNLLHAPLEVGDATEITGWPMGEWFVTVIRKERPLPDSPLIALTTRDPLPLYDGRFVLLVFDTSFRLMDPVDNNDATSQE